MEFPGIVRGRGEGAGRNLYFTTNLTNSWVSLQTKTVFKHLPQRYQSTIPASLSKTGADQEQGQCFAWPWPPRHLETSEFTFVSHWCPHCTLAPQGTWWRVCPLTNSSQLYSAKAWEILVPGNEIKDSQKPFVPWGYEFLNHRGFAARSLSPCRNQPCAKRCCAGHRQLLFIA